MTLLNRVGYMLSCWLSCPRPWHRASIPIEEGIPDCLEPGDVLLIEGSSRLSTVIKYLTQSTWSHAALYVGEAACRDLFGATRGECLVEADLAEGVRLAGLEQFDGYPLRICRPLGLSEEDIERLVTYACRRVGHRYDLHNIFDLARYLLPLPPVPVPWRRRMLSLGSGDPTRAICSTLIAQAFQSVRYPILPFEEWQDDPRRCVGCQRRVLQRRHYSLFTPRDFDLSPYFEIVKPALAGGFDPRRLAWRETEDALPEV
ncbi:YiiX/YebB-like N1pC/P60 family cysteine hydrolase [Halomonas sp. LBP4]|uniref:YiiX/YebB-like N1pC/P60 family cysteine hydrolase n=1 Tax=Halomonas sp. LBP4 TaxID=2044917 RepID=UPI000D755B21|nr:YiiX/YebB-like N1pC/P60 family cysteine hydrolase [Halomonas sp. LBP4]PXX99960.1 lipo-like protein [Halomonas sp. LBP4]